MRGEDDAGVAVVTVIGLMAVVVILAATIAASSITAAAFATGSRAELQSRAAADAGIDAVRAQMAAGHFVCSLTGSDPTFSATVTYYGTGGASLPCLGATVSGTPVRATVIANGSPSVRAIRSDSEGNAASVGANLDIVVTPGGVSLQQAVFTEASVELTNNMNVMQSSAGAIDGHVYSNGAIDCKTSNVVQGMIFARDGITIHNTCQALGSVWAQGDINLSASSVNLEADVFATGNVYVGTGHVGGNVIANGNVRIDNSSNRDCPAGGKANVCGSVYALNGGVDMGTNTTLVKGSIYARKEVRVANRNPAVEQEVVSLEGPVRTTNGGKIAGSVRTAGNFQGFQNQNLPSAVTSCASHTGYTPCTASQLVLPITTAANPAFVTDLGVFGTATPTNLGTPTNTVSVVAPPRQGFPHIYSSASEIAANWNDWAKPAVTTQMCTNQNNSLRDLINGLPVGSKTLLVFPCAVSLDNFTVTMRSDIAMMSTGGFNFQNATKFQAAAGSTENQLMLIVPSDSPGVTWNPVDPVNYPGQLTPVCTATGGNKNINFSGNLQFDAKNRMFAYTPCEFALNNGGAFTGQVYSGKAKYLSQVTITRSLTSVPGVSIPGGAPSSASYSATINTRFDVAG